MKPADYYRQNKKWSSFLGKTGRVISSTFIRVSAPKFASQLPYSFCLVEIDGKRYELMGCGHEKLTAGDEVKCVLRRRSINNSNSIIDYGIKVSKI